jgi:nucleoside-diphosphate-sugar epimerase
LDVKLSMVLKNYRARRARVSLAASALANERTGGMAFPYERVAVTGGSGRLGRYVVAELVAQCDVTVVDVALPAGDNPYVAADVLDLDAVRAALAGQQAVVHLAAIDAAREAPEEAFFRTNVQGAWNVLQAAEEAAVRKVIVCSSSSAVGLGPDHPPQYLPIDEDHPMAPTDAYGMSKQVCETIAGGFARRGALEVLCIRPCLVVFPGFVHDMSTRLAAADGGAAPAAPAPAWSRETLPDPLPMTRSFVSPVDVARCFRLALAAEGAPFGIFYAAAEDSCSPLPTVDVVAREFGHTPEVRGGYGDNPRAGAYDVSRAREALGWQPRDRWDDYVRRVLAGEQSTLRAFA